MSNPSRVDLVFDLLKDDIAAMRPKMPPPPSVDRPRTPPTMGLEDLQLNDNQQKEHNIKENTEPIKASLKGSPWKSRNRYEKLPREGSPPSKQAGSEAASTLPSEAENPAFKLPDTAGTLGPWEWYSPILALSKFPYKFVAKSTSEAIADKFFNAGKFWEREWELYYITIPNAKPVLFVREGQFKQLLADINRGFTNSSFKITDYYREEGLSVRFPKHPKLQPRYLGLSRTRDEYNFLEMNCPDPMFTPTTEPVTSRPDDRSIEAFKQTIELAIDAAKNKTKKIKEKKKADRFQRQQDIGKGMKRVERYLGLRPRNDTDDIDSSTATWTDQDITRHTAAPLANAVDPSNPVPYPFDQSVVFICVDVEAYERNHDIITEIGIATLDSRDLCGIAPGENATNWFSKIRARHFRIEEHKNYRNGAFISHCPDNFEFGESEWIQLGEAPQAIAACFRPPYSKPGAAPDDMKEKRNIVLVGHDTITDINYLREVGYDVTNLGTLLEVQDTAQLDRFVNRSMQPQSLGHILYDYEIAGWNLHNAGNDAAYTLQAMLAIAVDVASHRGDPDVKTRRERATLKRIEDAARQAAEREKEHAEGWSDPDEWDDGGVPVGPMEPAYRKSKNTGSSNGSNRASSGTKTVKFEEQEHH